MSQESVASLNTQARLDASPFKQGAREMSGSLMEAAGRAQSAFGLISEAAAKNAESSFRAFDRALNPAERQSWTPGQIEKARLQQAQEMNRVMTAAQDEIGNAAVRSAQVYAQAFAAEEQINSARIQQAQEVNRSITASYDNISRKASESMAAFREMFAQEDMISEARVQQAIETNRAITREQDRVTNSARASASAFTEAWNRTGARVESVGQRINKEMGAIQIQSRRTGQIAQQFGFQIQDYFVQVGSGTSRLVALAQQGSQLLGFFGPQGAIAGAALAISAVTLRLAQTEQQAKKTKEEVESLDQALKKLGKTESESRFNALNPGAQADELRRQIQSAQSAQQEFLRKSEAMTPLAAQVGRAESRTMFGTSANTFYIPTDGDMSKLKRFYQLRFDLIAQGRDPEAVAESFGLEEFDSKAAALARVRQLADEYQAKAVAARNEEIVATDKLNKLNEQRTKNLRDQVDELTRRNKKFMDDPLEKSLKRVSDRFSAEQDEMAKQEKFADSVKDALDPMREKVRLQEELNEAIKYGMLTQEEADKFMQKRFGPADNVSVDIPVNAWQRQGLFLAGGAGNSPADELKIMNRTLAEIERNTRDGGTWRP